MAMESTNDDEILCYCFGFTRRDVADDLRQNGTSTLLKKITRAKGLGECRCMETHPEQR